MEKANKRYFILLHCILYYNNINYTNTNYNYTNYNYTKYNYNYHFYQQDTLQFVSAPITQTCTNGISLFNPAAPVYGGKIFTPIVKPDWIGRNDFTNMVGTW